MSKVTRFWNPVVRQACTQAVMPPAGPERTVATAFLAVAAKVDMPPFDCMMYFCCVVRPASDEARIEIVDVAGEDRLQVGVDDRRREPVILADLRHDLAGKRDRAIGNFLGDDGAGPLLVMRERETKTTGTPRSIDVVVGELAQRLAQRRLVERQQHLAVEGDALGDLAGAALRDEQRRPVVHDVEDGRPVRARLLGDFVDAAKAVGDQEAGPHALAFEQRVGADRRAVAEISRCPAAVRPGRAAPAHRRGWRARGRPASRESWRRKPRRWSSLR